MDITDPTLVFLLISLGLVGIGVETLTPGGFIAGLVGVAALILGIIGIGDVGSLSWGIALLLVAIAFFIAAVALKSYRVLSFAGVVALAASGIFMFDRSTDPTSIPAVVIGAGVLGGFMVFVIERAGNVRSAPVRTGREELIGKTGEVRSGRMSPGRGPGQIFVAGALWRAELSDGSDPVTTGDRVRVDEVNGLTLLVSNFHRGDAAAQPTDKTDKEGVV